MSRIFSPYRKAYLAGAMAFLGALAAALDGGLTFTEFAGAWIAGLLAALTVYSVPNTPERPAPPSTETWVEKRLRTDEGNQPRR